MPICQFPLASPESTGVRMTTRRTSSMAKFFLNLGNLTASTTLRSTFSCLENCAKLVLTLFNRQLPSSLDILDCQDL